ncbi:VOC family protein [Deinococcus oregonensis]|uniref:VOC family protein n=1 Tax=Deinococcus oregonensis TaxID=1805970 RepID=A0ABV6AY05_9DEIO
MSPQNPLSAPGTSPVQGLHHVTVMAQDPQRNIDFYSQTLGQRLVKVTVNFDDPGTYHLYYGDLTGQPGTIMTHFPWPAAKRGVRGNGEVVATAYSAPRASEGYWRERLTSHGFALKEDLRFGERVLTLEDPDGTWVELVFDDGQPVEPWPASPVPAEHELRGFHSVTAWVGDPQPVRNLLVGQLGFGEEGTEQSSEGGQRTRFRGSGSGVGLFVDVVARPGQPRGTFGAGSVHHVALRTRNDAEQLAYLESLTAAGFRPTPVQDRQYFHSIYFREQGGVLFEIATDAPGFPDDEPVNELGKHLKLPTWYEAQRPAIEANAPKIVSREYGVTIGNRDLSAVQESAPEDIEEAGGVQVYAAGRPLAEARVAMVLLHGRGGTAADILTLADDLNLSAFAYLAPQAEGNTWYPQSFLAPVAQNQPDLDQALATVGAVIDALGEQGIEPQHVVLGGFSQGACLALEYASRAATQGQRLGGVVALSGGLITLDQGSELSGTPIFMGVAPDDAHIPLSRFQASADQLKSRGAQVDARVYPGLGHSINKDELDAVRRVMQSVAALV